MATFDSDELKSSSQFIPDSITLSSVIPSGVTGTLATITPAANKRAALLFMSMLGTTNQAGVSVVIGGSTVIPAGTLTGDTDSVTGAGRFKIGASAGSSSILMVVAKRKGQAIQIVKNAGNTVQDIIYISAIGD